MVAPKPKAKRISFDVRRVGVFSRASSVVLAHFHADNGAENAFARGRARVVRFHFQSPPDARDLLHIV
jgi:hypothetical protein